MMIHRIGSLMLFGGDNFLMIIHSRFSFISGLLWYLDQLFGPVSGFGELLLLLSFLNTL